MDIIRRLKLEEKKVEVQSFKSLEDSDDSLTSPKSNKSKGFGGEITEAVNRGFQDLNDNLKKFIMGADSPGDTPQSNA
jgi:hypothetical protein